MKSLHQAKQVYFLLLVIADESSRPNVSKEKAFDGDGLTFYESKKTGDGWIRLGFSEPVKIEKLRYLSRNEDDNVWKGNQYELVYWDDNQWISLGKQVVAGEKLIYKNVLGDALLLLHNLTKKKNEFSLTIIESKFGGKNRKLMVIEKTNDNR